MALGSKGLAAWAGAFAAGTAATLAVSSRRWDAATRSAMAAVRRQAALADSGPTHFSPGQLEGVPPAAARYFRFALTEGQPLVRTALIEHAGTFLMKLGGRRSRFTSRQLFSARRPAFVWDARIHMVPLVPMMVRDSYLSGRGGILGRMGGLVTVVNQAGAPELASGALMRWLAEAIWFPTALLPSNGVEWEAAEDGMARATIRDGGVSATIEMHFGESGQIERIRADRYRDDDGVSVLTPWSVRVREYRRVSGMMIPLAGEVEWGLPEGRLVYWRGRVTGTRYELAAAPVR